MQFKVKEAMMLGAIAGDMIGSVYEFDRIKTINFPLFSPDSELTDDTVLTVATAWSLLNGCDYVKAYKHFGLTYPSAGYGALFTRWLNSDNPEPYNSFGNGSAMRVSPVGWARNSIESVLNEAAKSSSVTHNHPEGIKGAQAVALAVYLARTGSDKIVIKRELENRFAYNIDRPVADIRPFYGFEQTCQHTVPEAITAFLESKDFEDTIRLAVSLGGDSDTLACIAGAVAEAYYGHLPENIADTVWRLLPGDLIEVIEEFRETFITQ